MATSLKGFFSVVLMAVGIIASNCNMLFAEDPWNVAGLYLGMPASNVAETLSKQLKTKVKLFEPTESDQKYGFRFQSGSLQDVVNEICGDYSSIDHSKVIAVRRKVAYTPEIASSLKMTPTGESVIKLLKDKYGQDPTQVKVRGGLFFLWTKDMPEDELKKLVSDPRNISDISNLIESLVYEQNVAQTNPERIKLHGTLVGVYVGILEGMIPSLNGLANNIEYFIINFDDVVASLSNYRSVQKKSAESINKQALEKASANKPEL